MSIAFISSKKERDTMARMWFSVGFFFCYYFDNLLIRTKKVAQSNIKKITDTLCPMSMFQQSKFFTKIRFAHAKLNKNRRMLLLVFNVRIEFQQTKALCIFMIVCACVCVYSMNMDNCNNYLSIFFCIVVLVVCRSWLYAYLFATKRRHKQ